MAGFGLLDFGIFSKKDDEKKPSKPAAASNTAPAAKPASKPAPKAAPTSSFLDMSIFSGGGNLTAPAMAAKTTVGNKLSQKVSDLDRDIETLRNNPASYVGGRGNLKANAVINGKWDVNSPGIKGILQQELRTLQMKRAALDSDLQRVESGKKNDGVLSDIGSSLRSGVGSTKTGAAWLGKKIGLDTRDLQESGEIDQQVAQESFSDETNKIRQEGVFGDQKDVGDRLYAALLGGTESVPGMVALLPATAVATAALPEAAAVAIGTRAVTALAPRAPWLLRAVGLTAEQAATKEGAAIVGRQIVGTMAGSAGEGVQAAGNAGFETEKQVAAQIDADPAAFAQTELGKQLLEQTGGDITKARDLAASQVANNVALTTGVATSLLALPGSAFEARVLGGLAKKGALKEAGVGALSEGLLQEAPQSGAEKLISNVGMQSVGSDVGTFEGVGKAAAEGGVIGGLIGGGFGAAGGAATPTNRIPANPREDVELRAALEEERGSLPPVPEIAGAIQDQSMVRERESTAAFMDTEVGALRVKGLNLKPTQILETAQQNADNDPRIASIIDQPVSEKTKVEQIARIYNGDEASKAERLVAPKISPLVGGKTGVSQMRLAIETELSQVGEEVIAESPVLSAMAQAVAKSGNGKYTLGSTQALETVRGALTSFTPTARDNQLIVARPERGGEGSVLMTEDQVSGERQREREADQSFRMADARQRRYEQQTFTGGQREDLRPNAPEPKTEIFLNPEVYGADFGGLSAEVVASENPGMVRIQYESPSEVGQDGTPVIISEEVSPADLIGRVIRGTPRMTQDFTGDQRRPQRGVGTEMAGPRNSIDRTSSKSMTETPQPGVPMAAPIEPNIRYEGSVQNNDQVEQPAKQQVASRPAIEGQMADQTAEDAQKKVANQTEDKPQLEDKRDQGGEKYSGRTGEADAPQADTQNEAEDQAEDVPNYQSVIQDRLDKLAARGRQGRVLSNRIRSLLKNKKLTARQLYYAFQMGEVMSRVLPKNAGIDIIFVPSLTATDAVAAENSATKLGAEIPGKVQMYEISQNGFRGLITMSLSDSVLSVARENAAHEAFHVIQDMLFVYDQQAYDQINQSFYDGMRLDDLDASIIRTLKTLSLDGSVSVYNSLKADFGDTPFGSAFEAQAVAFGALVDAKDRGAQMKGLKASFLRFIEMLSKFRREVKNLLRGTGVQSVADIFDGYRTGKAQENLTERAPLVGEGGMDVEQYAARGVFPVPQRLFDQVGIPEEQRTRGGTYIDPKNREVFTGRTFGDATISVDPETGKPSFMIDDETETEAPTPNNGPTVKTNLFKQKAGWKWVGDDRPAKTLVSVETRGKHFYTLATKFDTPVTLKSYPDAPSEPRLRPTTFGEITLGEQVGEIDVRGKRHPVYEGIAVHQKGVQYSARTGKGKTQKPEYKHPEIGAQKIKMPLRGTSTIPFLYNNGKDKVEQTPGQFMALKDSVQFIQARTRTALMNRFGIDRIVGPNPDTDAYLAKAIASEAEAAILKERATGNRSALDWYTSAIEDAIKEASAIYPMLADDQIASRLSNRLGINSKEDARVAFTLALSITSQNMKVRDNARATVEQFDIFLETGRFDPTRSYGTKAPSISGNLSLANFMLEQVFDRNIHDFGSFLNTEFTVSQLNGLAKGIANKAGLDKPPFSISGEQASEVVYGSAIFGPKIGNGFYQNLNRNFSPVTIDLWFMRLWGRLTGTLVGNDTAIAKQAQSLREAIEADSHPTIKVPDGYVETVKNATDDEMVGIAVQMAAEWERQYKVFQKQGLTSKEITDQNLKPDWAYKAVAIAGQLKPNDAPTSGGQRKWIRDVVKRSVAMLAKNGYGVTPADLQALVWYPEKDLINLFKEGKLEANLNVSYDTAFKELAAQRNANDQTTDANAGDRTGDGAARRSDGGRRADQTPEQADPALAAGAAEEEGDKVRRTLPRETRQRLIERGAMYSGRTGRGADTPAFQEWFGESVLVDGGGNPQVLYHGTADDVEQFDLNSPNRKDSGYLGTGVYLTDETFIANTYADLKEKKKADRQGGNVMPMFARLENPFFATMEDKVRNRDGGRKAADAFTADLKAKGHDGVILEARGGGREIVVFDPSGVKSTLNRGTFDRADERIAYSGRTGNAALADWFGDSKVVDEDGGPLTVYTGTSKDTIFKSFKVGPRGTWFTTDPAEASGYAEQNDSQRLVRDDTYGASPWAMKQVNTASRVIPTYLKIENPKVYTGNELRDAVYEKGGEAYARGEAALFRELIAAGHDGVQLTGNAGGDTWVVLKDPRQIKSIFNQSFDPKDVKYSGRVGKLEYERMVNSGRPLRPAPSFTNNNLNFGGLEPGQMDDIIYQLQDKLIDIKRVQENITEAGGRIGEDANVYRAEELYHGRAAKRAQDFVSLELEPLIQDMKAKGVSLEMIDEFLQARHAKERNAQIAKLNPSLPDGGSGMTNAAADAYMAGLPNARRKQLENLAKRVDAIIAETQKMMVDYGLESQSTIDTWNKTYSAYVPLQREGFEDDMAGSGGQGMSIGGSTSRRATGSTRGVVDILANVAMQRERVITRGERNRVGNAIMSLALQNPNDGFWFVIDPKSKSVGKAVQKLVAFGIDPEDATNIMGKPVETYVDQNTGRLVVRANSLIGKAPNVMATRINGEDRFVIFNARNPRAARTVTALKNLDTPQIGGLIGGVGKVTRYFASINTQYNPAFGLFNLMRDIQGATLNLSTTPLADKKAKVISGTWSALSGMYGDLRNQRKGEQADSEWAKLAQEFEMAGGKTGFRDLFRNSTERTDAIMRELDPTRMQKVVDKTAGPVFDWLSDFNEAIENSVRLSAYKVARDSGISQEEAASIAKNITVNFNRKGAMGSQAGMLYAFFNASVQGTARLTETLRGPAGKKIVTGGLLLGFAQAVALAAAGFEEDEVPDWVKDKNLIFPAGDSGRYVAIPMPLGFHVIPALSRRAAEYFMSDGKSGVGEAIEILGLMADAFNPIGNGGTLAETLSPTVTDPIVQLTTNRDFAGRPIYNQDFNSLDPTPGPERTREGASIIGEYVSLAIDRMTGGSGYVPGKFSPTGDQVDFLIGAVTGGAGRTVLNTISTAKSAVTGEDLPNYKIPVVGRMIGDKNEASAVSNRFYQNVKEMNGHQRQIKGMEENGEDSMPYYDENPAAWFAEDAADYESQLRSLKKEKKQMIADGEEQEFIDAKGEEIQQLMTEFNQRLDDAKRAKK